MGAVIGIDARMAGRVPTGLGTYATHLVCALTARDPSNSYVVIRGPATPPLLAKAPNVEEVVLPGHLDTPRNLLRGGDISRLGLDLYHGLHHFLPPGLRVPHIVLTLHDLIWIEHRRLILEGHFGAIRRAGIHVFARAAMGYAIRRADRIIAVSEHTRSRALAYYGVDPARIDVVHHGIDHDAFRPRIASASADRRPYFVCLGNTRPYKNIPTALHALALCARESPDVYMVVAGRGDSARPLKVLARKLGLEQRVTFVGSLAHADLLQLLHGATALVFPSVVEGFGFPVLEAMSAGCPVIISTCPTLGETAGTAALFCDANEPAEFAAAMMQLVANPQLCDQLRERGRRQASLFSWDRCASRTLATYQSLLQRVRHERTALASAAD